MSGKRAQDNVSDVERLRAALRTMVYETTHLSPCEPDGSHWCKISGVALAEARAALAVPINKIGEDAK